MLKRDILYLFPTISKGVPNNLVPYFFLKPPGIFSNVTFRTDGIFLKVTIFYDIIY